MSDFKAEIVQISSVTQHPNADRLDYLTFNNYAWCVIVGREDPAVPRHKVGDQVIYIPIDSVLPPKLECLLFPPGSKIVLEKSRVKTIKIRKCISQGMAIGRDGLVESYPDLAKAKLGDDVTAILGITKFEPPEHGMPQHMRATSKRRVNTLFKAYCDIQNFKYYPDAFDTYACTVSEKLHGTSARYACLPKEARTLWEKVLEFFGKLPSHEYCYGSRRVQLQEKAKDHKTFYDDNVYALVGEKYHLREVLAPGHAVYGEIIGHGIQGGYNYGHKPGEYSFYAYDVMIDGRYLPPHDFFAWCKSRKIPTVPVLYAGPFDRDLIESLRSGPSTTGQQAVREGIVIKSLEERIDPRFGRLILKYINDDYLLLKDNTDFH